MRSPDLGLALVLPPSLPKTVLLGPLSSNDGDETRETGLVIMGDSAHRLEQCTVADLQAAARQRRRGAPRLRQVIPLLDARSESASESVMRVLHQATDIPVEPQHKVYAPSGRFVARGDLWIVGTRRLHEYDGADHRLKKTHNRDLAHEAAVVEIN